MSAIDRKDVLDALHAHYNATFDVVKTVWDQRNAAGAYLFAACTLLLLPEEAQRVLVRYVLGQESALSGVQFHLVVQLAVLVLTLLLTQRQTFLDKHYLYLAALEQRLNDVAGVELFVRESRYYTEAITPRQKSGLWYGSIYLYALSSLVCCASLRSAWSAAAAWPAWLAWVLLGPLLGTLALLALYWLEKEPTRAAAQSEHQRLRSMLATWLTAHTDPPAQPPHETPETAPHAATHRPL